MKFSYTIKGFIAIVLIVLFATSFKQEDDYFEGIIIYKNTFKFRDPEIDTAKFINAFGGGSEFYYKNGNYLQFFNGSYNKVNLCLIKDNLSYILLGTSDTLFWIDNRKPIEKIISDTIELRKEIVLNRNCNKLTIITNTLTNKFYRKVSYFYYPDIKINPTWYNEFKLNSYDFIFKKTKALPLKIINDKGGVIITMTAVDIRRQKLSDSLFHVAKDVKLAPFRF